MLPIGFITPAFAALPATAPADGDLWVGRFSQCSYNALASAMVDLEGPVGPVANRKAFEQRAFVGPIDAAGYEPYFGWGPWTSYIVNSGKMVWDGHVVTDVSAERFALRPKQPVTIEDQTVIVHYAPGEREQLRRTLLTQLQRGPVLLWTSYCGGMGGDWHVVKRIDDADDAVPFAMGLTHSVTLFLRPGNAVLVTDCSVRHGVYMSDLDTIVAISAAMTGVVRLKENGHDGKSLLDNGFHGVNDDQYNVVFVKHAATTAPATPTTDPSAARGAWDAAIAAPPSNARPGMAFVVRTLSQRDLDNLDPTLVRADVEAAYAMRARVPWGKDVPDEIFFQAVLPPVNLSERRENWRPTLAAECVPLIDGCRNAGEAAVALNDKLFPLLNVKYHPTKRPKPDQSPSESVAAGYASCTGLSILLVDACRSVGVPARVVGTPQWCTHVGDGSGNHAGNHTWVEVWDHQWHVLGASEATALDQTWFLDNASKQISAASDPRYKIYAAVPGASDGFFPMVWAPEDTSVRAQDVTADYADRKPVTVTVDAPSHVTLRQHGRLIADLDITDRATLVLCPGQTYDATVRHDGKEITAPVAATRTMSLKSE